MKKLLSVCICLAALLLLAGCSYDVRLGQTESGAVVKFTRVGQKTYGVTVTRADGDILQQLSPVKLYLGPGIGVAEVSDIKVVKPLQP